MIRQVSLVDTVTSEVRDNCLCRNGEIELPDWVNVRVPDGLYEETVSNLFEIGPLRAEFVCKLRGVENGEATYEIIR